jgi:hypothetical protein
MIMEWKEPDSGIRKSAAECKACGEGAGGSNNYRINIGIHREAKATQLRWYLTGEHPQPCRKAEWTYSNPDVEVPLGRWFFVEAYMKKHATAGRVYFAVNGQVVWIRVSPCRQALRRRNRARRPSSAAAILVADEELSRHGMESRGAGQPMVRRP